MVHNCIVAFDLPGLGRHVQNIVPISVSKFWYALIVWKIKITLKVLYLLNWQQATVNFGARLTAELTRVVASNVSDYTRHTFNNLLCLSITSPTNSELQNPNWWSCFVLPSFILFCLDNRWNWKKKKPSRRIEIHQSKGTNLTLGPHWVACMQTSPFFVWDVCMQANGSETHIPVNPFSPKPLWKWNFLYMFATCLFQVTKIRGVITEDRVSWYLD